MRPQRDKASPSPSFKEKSLKKRKEKAPVKTGAKKNMRYEFALVSL